MFLHSNTRRRVVKHTYPLSHFRTDIFDGFANFDGWDNEMIESADRLHETLLTSVLLEQQQTVRCLQNY